MTVKRSSELLDDVFKQIYYAKLQHHRPELRIWMNHLDIETLVLETKMIPKSAADIENKGKTVTKLFGYDLYSADDTTVGKPIVEVINDEGERND